MWSPNDNPKLESNIWHTVKSTFRSRFDRKTIVDHLYISTNIPTLGDFDPRPVVIKWLSDKNRRRCQTPKATDRLG